MEIKGNIEPSKGNIKTDEDVIVDGNVMEGVTIETEKSIVIHGNVGNAILKAGREIIVKKGISGQGKGKIYAKGNIITKFAERATLNAGKNVIANVGLIDCNVDSGDKVIVLGKKGVIRGGVIRVNEEVWANEIGSTVETYTEINVEMKFSKGGMVVCFKTAYPGVKIVTPFVSRKLDKEFDSVGFLIREDKVEACPLDKIFGLKGVDYPSKGLELKEYKPLMGKLLELEIENLLNLGILDLVEIRSLFW